MVAMLAMAKRKIEHWIFWIIGNVLSIPLYFLKGYTITSVQYVVFLILAIAGYIQWKKFLNKPITNSLK
jgi:nicotinamide mononucleotide transporter